MLTNSGLAETTNTLIEENGFQKKVKYLDYGRTTDNLAAYYYDIHYER